MRIKIINPDYGMTENEIAERLILLKQAAGRDVELSMQCLQTSHVYLDSMLDAALAGPEIIRMAIDAEAQGYDAVVLYCFSDPAVDACREVLKIPVVGGGQAACLSAMMVSRQFGILLSQSKRVPEKYQFLYQTGISFERVCGIVGADHDGDLSCCQESVMLSRLEAAGRTLIEDCGAQAIVLGCLSFLGKAAELSTRLGVPVIDSAIASVVMAVACVRMKLQTSPVSYPLPPSGIRTWSGGEIIIS